MLKKSLLGLGALAAFLLAAGPASTQQPPIKGATGSIGCPIAIT